MPAIETVAIINKSGKVVSTSKHLVNIFKDAKEAYLERKAEIKAEHRNRTEEKAAQKRLENLRFDDLVISQRPRVHRSGSRRASQHDRPPLTEDNLSRVSDSRTESRHGSRRGSRHGGSVHSKSPRSPPIYQAPFAEDSFSRPDLARRHTEHQLGTNPEAQKSSISGFGPPHRSLSSPDLEADIDMNLAYGDLPDSHKDLVLSKDEREAELNGLMTKLDSLMMEAQCVQHTATTIIASLQKNPEAMAAVALTLAEISNLLTKMSPGILTALKSGSPAVFALLASPQFLIAGGVAVGVTIVMFGGYKIIKRIQDNVKKEKEEAMRMDEALAYEGDLSSIESWRRGIANAEVQSVGTSVDGEFITPQAQRIRKERIRERAREEGKSRRAPSSVASSNASTIRRKPVGERSSSKSKVTDADTVITGYSERTESTVKPKKKEKKDKEKEKLKEPKAKKSNALTLFFKKQEEGRSSKKTERSEKSEKSHRPDRDMLRIP